jgi:abortive infection bacteriophage resistance protein
MMISQKKFTSFSEQMDWLQNEKHLIINDPQYAEDILRRIGYFPLIGGYKHLFRIPLTKKYKEGTSFEEIYALYLFDVELRELFFKYLLQIEKHLRSLMSYYFSETYGEAQSAYLDIEHFNNSRQNHKTIVRLISTLQRAVRTTDYVYINYYRNTYGNIPLWVLINILTFGNLSKMYQVFPQSLQSKICKSIGTVNRRQMEQFLSILTKFRNVCAHGERLFTYRTVDAIADLPIHKKMEIPLNGEQYIYGKKDLFAVVIAFRYLLPAKDFLSFKRKLSQYIDRVAHSVIHISETELLHQMGFPQNWKNITRYRLN